MPKLVDPVARFAFLRRAAFLVVRDHGPRSLSRRTLASTLGMSDMNVRRMLAPDADLRQLALDEVESLRRGGRWWRPRDLDGPDLTLFLLRRLLPDEDTRLPEELVWLRVAIDARRLVLGDGDTAAALRVEYQIAERGYASEEPAWVDDPTAPVDPLDDPLAERWAENGARVAHATDEALAVLGIDAEIERSRTRALVSGLTLEACLGRITPAEAVATLEHHVASLSRTAQPSGPAAPTAPSAASPPPR